MPDYSEWFYVHRACLEIHTHRYRCRDTVYHITVRCVGEKSEHVNRVAVDGAGVDVTDIGGTGRPQGKLIPLVDDRREHYVEVDLG